MLTLYLAELKRRWGMMKAYPGEEIISTLLSAFFFYMLFLGAKFMVGPTAQFGDRLDSMIVGYFVWILLTHTYAGIAHDLNSESTTGTIDQLLTTPAGIGKIFLMRSLANVTVSIFITSFVAFIIMLLTGRTLHLSPFMTLPIVSIILASTGLGFMLGSLVFVMKRASSIMVIAQFALLFAVRVPHETWGTTSLVISSLIPITPGAAALRSILVHESPDLILIGLAALNACAYLPLGMWIFKKAENLAKRRGIVSTY